MTPKRSSSSEANHQSCSPDPPADVDAAGCVTLEFSFGRYFGQVHPENPQMRHGEGMLSYHSGNLYKGSWKHGAPDGVGEKQYANGDVFVGLWSKGKREGRGSYLFNAGHIFEGMYCNDQPEKYGILTTVDGDRYSGGWKAGKKHGKGVEVLHEGQMFTGTWKDGVKDGPGKCAMPGAKSFIYGFWANDHFHREMTVEERAEWKVQRQREDKQDRETLGSDFVAPAKLLTGEGKEDWDSEFEFNSSDEERHQSEESERDANGNFVPHPPHEVQTTRPDLASLLSAATGNPQLASVPGLDGINAMETRLDVLEKALEDAMRGL